MVNLKEVLSLVTFQRVTCEAKVVSVDEVEEVSGGKKKQDVLLGDSTGTLRLTLWEEEIGKMEEGVSYKLCGMVVREFRGRKFLSTSKQNSVIETIDDIGDVEEEDTDEEGNSTLKQSQAIQVYIDTLYIA